MAQVIIVVCLTMIYTDNHHGPCAHDDMPTSFQMFGKKIAVVDTVLRSDLEHCCKSIVKINPKVFKDYSYKALTKQCTVDTKNIKGDGDKVAICIRDKIRGKEDDLKTAPTRYDCGPVLRDLPKATSGRGFGGMGSILSSIAINQQVKRELVHDFI